MGLRSGNKLSRKKSEKISYLNKRRRGSFKL